ncbi:MAG: glycoside hydrolase family 43 protein [Treponema sp.]|jgi:xylan 1,4-beta-xylosidase|nr:glycoside hydrolase family 43 protein [Treponema sp.]
MSVPTKLILKQDAFGGFFATRTGKEAHRYIIREWKYVDYHKGWQNSMKIKNPIIPGFSPDAGACQVGEDYYIATSTFEWWPGICIYHSRDLANWDPVSRPVTMTFYGVESSGGLWAPHLSWADGKFWLAITGVYTRTGFKDTLNYLTVCETIDGNWTEPIYINSSGFDPALFHDDDGRKYFLNMLWDYRPGHAGFAGIVMRELDPATMKLTGEQKKIFEVTGLGVAEGPQILKKDGWYYLLTAAGGTGYKHAAVAARSQSVWGPYEISPHHPLLTSAPYPDNPLQKAGHASFIHKNGDWYITHICARPLTMRGNCPLGRETALQKITWMDGWPRLDNGGNEPSLEVEISADAIQKTNHSKCTDFDDKELPDWFQTLRGPVGDAMTLTERPGRLRLYGRESLASLHRQALVAARWQSVHFRAETALEFIPKSFRQTAGLVCIYNTENWMYAHLTGEKDTPVLNVLICDNKKLTYAVEGVTVPSGIPLYLAVEVHRETLRFFYSTNSTEWQPLGGKLPAEHLSDDYIEKNGLVFTGAFVGICCQDLDDRTVFADFDFFAYQEM